MISQIILHFTGKTHKNKRMHVDIFMSRMETNQQVELMWNTSLFVNSNGNKFKKMYWVRLNDPFHVRWLMPAAHFNTKWNDT